MGEKGELELKNVENDIAVESERKRWLETVLRIFPIGLCLSALLLMVKSKQANDYGTLQYSHVSAFKYLAYANGFCAGYAVLSALNSVVPHSCTLYRAWIVFSFDQAFTYVILVAGAVATEVLYLAHEGDEKITWFEMCSYYGRFCNKAGASVIISFVACLCFVVLSLISAHRVFSKYEPPCLYQEDHQIISHS